MKRIATALYLLLGLAAMPFCRGEETHGVLTNSLSFESFPYQVYTMDSAGGNLSISLVGPDDPCLILGSPSGQFRVWEAPYLPVHFATNLTVVLTNAARGLWTAIATVKRARYYDRRELFTLTAQGITNLRALASDHLDTNRVEEAFSARGIETEARKLRRRIQAETEQLSLRSVRSNLVAQCRARYINEGTAIEEKKMEYVLLERKGQEIAQALGRVDALGASTNLVRELLQTEWQSTTNELHRLSDSLVELISTRNSYLRAERELDELEALRAELERLEETLLSVDSVPGASRRSLGDKLKELRATWTLKAERLSEKLIKSHLVSQSGGLISDYDFPRLTSSWSSSRIAAAYSGYTAAAQSWRLMNAQSASLTSIGAASTRSADADIREAFVDTSVWLPSLFPWPPPEASVKDVLDNRLLAGWPGGIKTLGDLDDMLAAALSAAGYPGASYFGVADGFALVTQLEQTAGDGMPLSGVARWSVTIREMKSFSLTQYVAALFTAPPGFFRVITFVATSKPFATSGDRANFVTLERWTQTGLNVLPQEVRSLPYTDSHRVTVLVYEFEKARNEDKPLTASPGRHTVREHLEKSKLLASLQTLLASSTHR